MSPHGSGAGMRLSEPCELCVLMESRLQPLAVGVVALPLGEHPVSSTSPAPPGLPRSRLLAGANTGVEEMLT